jgi:hypothetical protein
MSTVYSDVEYIIIQASKRRKVVRPEILMPPSPVTICQTIENCSSNDSHDQIPESVWLYGFSGLPSYQ